MVRDRGGNTLKQTKSHPLSKRLSDRVGGDDRDDLFSFKLSQKSAVDFTLSGVRQGAVLAVDVFQFKGAKRRVLKAIGSTPFSDLKPKDFKPYLKFLKRDKGQNTSYSLTLPAGEYYLRISALQGKTRYRTQIEADPVSNLPLPTPKAFSIGWVRQSGSIGNDYAYGTTIDAAGNLYVAGVTQEESSAGDAFIAKYSSSGDLQWRRVLALPGADIAFDVEVDNAGNYYAVGITDIKTSISSSGNDGFIIKYASDGSELWRDIITTGTYGGLVPKADAVSSIAIDAAGDVYIGGFLDAVPETANQGDALVAKYSATGTQRWLTRFGGSNADAASGVAVANNKVYLTGITDGTLTTNRDNLISGGDAFVASFDSANGDNLWSKTLASDEQDYARGIAIDTAGNIYITGQTTGNLSGANAGETDAFLAAYSATGTLRWVKQFGTATLDEAQAIAIDASNNIFVTGETTGALFGQPSIGDSDTWVAAFDAAGNVVRRSLFGTPQADESYGIVAKNGALYITGQTQGAFPNATNAGQYDVWIAKLLQP